MDNVDLYKELIRHINGPSGQFEKAFVELFKLEHPTLQQSLVRHLIVPALTVLKEQRPDARNQASHDFAVYALEAEAADPHGLYFPTI